MPVEGGIDQGAGNATQVQQSGPPPDSTNFRQGFKEAANLAKGREAAAPEAESLKPEPEVHAKPVAEKNGVKKPVVADPKAKVAAPVQKPANGTAPANGEAKPKPQINFAELRRKAEAYDKGEIPPKALERFKALEQQLNEFKIKDQSYSKEKEDFLRELTEHRTVRTALDLENTPEYQRDVSKPFAAAETNMAKIAKQFFQATEGSTPEQQEVDSDNWTDALWDAATDPDEVSRETKLYDLLSKNPRGAIIKPLIDRQVRVLEAVAQKQREMEEHSAGLLNQINAKRQSQTQQSAAQQQQEVVKARTDVSALLKNTLAELFASQDPEVQKLLTESESAEFVDNPMERALAARAVPIWMAQKTHYESQIKTLQDDLDAANQAIEEFSNARGGNGLARPGAANQGDAPPVDFGTGLKAATAQARRGV